MPCARCESLPENVDVAGALHLWLPVGHSRNKVAAYLRETGRSFELADVGGLVIPLSGQRTSDVLLPLAGLLGRPTALPATAPA